MAQSGLSVLHNKFGPATSLSGFCDQPKGFIFFLLLHLVLSLALFGLGIRESQAETSLLLFLQTLHRRPTLLSIPAE